MFDAFVVQIPIFFVLGSLTCISYFVLNTYTLDERTLLAYGIEPNAECTVAGQTSPCFQATMTFPEASYAVLAWLGISVFSIMGGVGFVVVPYDLFEEYIYRPKKITSDEFNQRKKVLLPKITKLRD